MQDELKQRLKNLNSKRSKSNHCHRFLPKPGEGGRSDGSDELQCSRCGRTRSDPLHICRGCDNCDVHDPPSGNLPRKKPPTDDGGTSSMVQKKLSLRRVHIEESTDDWDEEDD